MKSRRVPSESAAIDPAVAKVRSASAAESLDIGADIRDRIPRFERLIEHLHFNPLEGLIWLEDSRMALLHSESFSALRHELISALGVDGARGVLMRTGYVAGSRDAQIAWKTHGEASDLEAKASGAQFHALEGFVQVEPVRIEIDSASGHAYVEFVWKHSFEGELHVKRHGVGAEPVCWMQVGYSAGFLNTQMGKRIIAREVECVGMGHPHCRVIARPVEYWDDAERELRDLNLLDRTSQAGSTLRPREAVIEPHELAPHVEPVADSNTMVGASAAFTSVLHQVRRVAETRATVLLLGESGVGKNAFARDLHDHSARRDKPFVEINCAAIPENLVESELFGVERGAYSGAVESRTGRFEIAHGGTIFLDEIATLSITAQGKLLRVLQTGELERLGSTRTIKVDVRVVAATNEQLQTAVKQKRFREDLFYRLNVFPILIAPLRERKEDLPVLLEFYLAKFSKLHQRRLRGITPRALQALLSYKWPGNIREFENVIERGVILAQDGEALDIRHLSSVDASFESANLLGLSAMGALVARNLAADAQTEPTVEEWALRAVQEQGVSLDAIEDALIKAAVERTHGNISKAAALLGISRAQLDYRVKKARNTAE